MRAYIILGIKRALNAYELETGCRLKSITLGKDQFTALLSELSRLKETIGNDPYTDGIMIDSVQIEWKE